MSDIPDNLDGLSPEEVRRLKELKADIGAGFYNESLSDEDDFDEDSGYPNSWEDCPPLTPETEELRTKFIEGIRRFLTSEVAQTIEVDSKADNEVRSLPQQRYLRRMVFLKAGEALSSGIPRFQLAISLNGHLLDGDQADNLSDDEIRNRGLIWPDGIELFLLDNSADNFRRMELLVDTARPQTDVTGAKMGFSRSVSDPSKLYDIESGVYGISYGLDSGVGITIDGYDDHLDNFRLVAAVVENGTWDQEAARRSEEFIKESGRGKDLSMEPAMVRSIPYFDKIMDRVLAPQGLEPSLKWDQYWSNRVNPNSPPV